MHTLQISMDCCLFPMGAVLSAKQFFFFFFVFFFVAHVLGLNLQNFLSLFYFQKIGLDISCILSS